MANLPPSRITANSKPFFDCGLDYLGPLWKVEATEKLGGLLFTSLSSRAIHVELVTLLSLSKFLLAFTRFVNLRGHVNKVLSDNESTFQAASKKLSELIESREFQNSLRHKGINSEFILAYSPAQGGVWKAMVKQFKIVLTHILTVSRRKPNFLELLTYN